MDIIKSIEHEQLKKKVPAIKVGDTVKVHVRVKEGNRERIQVFEGIVIKKQGGGVNETFTVRRISYGVGVEKTFLLHSPTVEKVETIRVGKVRRAKLYYLRDRVGKSAKTKEKIGARIPGEEDIVEELTMESVAEAAEAVEETKQEENVGVGVLDNPIEEKPETVATEVMDTVKEEVVEKVEEKTQNKETE